MKDLKLTEILSAFTPDEIRRFRKFVESPYHNGSVNVTNFFKEVVKYYPDFSSRNYNLNYIHSKLFPQKKYHEGVMRNLASDLYKLAESFLVFENTQHKDFEYGLSLLKEFKKRGLTDLFNINYKKILSNLNKTRKDESYLFNLYQLEREFWSLFIVDKKTGRKHGEFVSKVTDNSILLIKFFLARLLTTYCSIVSNAVDFDSKPELRFYNEIKQHIEKYKYDDTPAIKLYFNSLKLSMGDADENTFDQLHVGIKKDKNKLGHNDLHVLYISILNYTIIKRNFEACFEIINEILEGEYYTRRGKDMFMEYGFYSASVHTGLYLKKFKWVENFIKNYREKINPPHRDNAHFYHYSLFEFIKKNFEKAADLLSNLSPTDFFLLIYTQRLRLAIYYELGRTEEIYSIIDSFKHTLTRHTQVEERHKKIYRDFLENFTMLHKLKLNYDDYQHSILKVKILNQNDHTVFKQWFNEKLFELKK